jgi:hypothetical protein
VPRTEERHNEMADLTRRPVYQPVSEPGRRPRSPELLVTEGIIFRTGPPRARDPAFAVGFWKASPTNSRGISVPRRGPRARD